MLNIFFLNLTLTNKNYGNPTLSPFLGGTIIKHSTKDKQWTNKT